MELIASVCRVSDIPRLITAGMSGCILSCEYFATRHSHYFTKEEIEDVKEKYPRLHLYTNINRIFAQSELHHLEKHLVWCKCIGFVGIYYSDPAVYMLAKQLGMEAVLIYNQDTVLTNSYDIQAYLDLGIKRCVISREITLEEVVQVIKNCGSRLEMMVHGHMNLSYSKRQLLSCYFDEIHKDYDSHKVYLLEEETRSDKMYIMEDEQGTHIFTGQRLQMVKELHHLFSIEAVRIETIFMNINEIEEAVSYYRQLLNGMDMDSVYENWIQQNPKLYTSGYLYHKTNISK